MSRDTLKQRDGMTFFECVVYCGGVPSFVQEFDRLTGSHLWEIATRSPIEAMIDKATGRDREELMRFCAFVYEYVWTRGDW